MQRLSIFDVRRPTATFLGGTLAAALLFIGGPLVFFNPPQCPFEYSQEQVDASNCIVGANIGLPFLMLFGTLIWIIVTAVLAALLYTEHRQR